MKKIIFSLMLFNVVVTSLFSIDEMIKKEFSDYVEAGNLADALTLFHKIAETENRVDLVKLIEDNPKFLSNLKLEQISIPAKTVAGKCFNKAFGIKASFVFGNKKTSLANTPFIIEHPVQQEDGSFSMMYKLLKTDDEGKLIYKEDVFKKPLNAKISFALKLFKKTENEPRPSEYSIRFTHSKNILSVFDCKVSTTKKQGIRASIAIMDFNENGKAHSRSTTATTLLGELLKRGFWGAGIYETKTLWGDDDNAVIKDVRKVFSGNVYDFIFGRVKILELNEVNGQWECKARVSLKFWDFKKEKLKKEITEETVAFGKTKWEAVNAVRRKFAIEILPDVIECGYEFN